MANELEIDVSVSYADSSGTTDSLELPAPISVTVSGKQLAHLKQSIGTTEEALSLGGISSLGYVLFINRDEDNFVEIRTGTGGDTFAKLKAGEVALLRIGSDVTAPYAVADTASVDLEYLLFSS